MAEGAWGPSWGVSWGPSWGKTAISESLDSTHSGVTRLWMYQLYAESIEKDHKERSINQPEPVVVAAAQPKPQKPKQRRVRRATAKLEAKVAHKPLPRYAPAFVKPVDKPSITEYLAELSPLPVLKDYIKETKVAKEKEVKVKKKKHDEEWLLLMAA